MNVSIPESCVEEWNRLIEYENKHINIITSNFTSTLHKVVFNDTYEEQVKAYTLQQRDGWDSIDRDLYSLGWKSIDGNFETDSIDVIVKNVVSTYSHEEFISEIIEEVYEYLESEVYDSQDEED